MDADLRKLEALLAERDAQIARMFAEFQAAADDAAREIAEMRKITGPPCPKCGHWLRAEHNKTWATRRIDDLTFAFFQRSSGERCITVTNLLTNHPLIAAELGLEAKDVS